MDKQILDGTVVMITEREVVVDINFKSDGVLSFNEFNVSKLSGSNLNITPLSFLRFANLVFIKLQILPV